MMNEPKTQSLEVQGAVLTFDVRTNESGTEPILFMFGSPMGAQGFVTLARHFEDRTVVTYDPRGAERSKLTDGAKDVTPDQHADDLDRLIGALDAGPVDIFATSGGAVNSLALVARRPEQVRTLVAHEPPAGQVLPDRETILAACVDIRETYERDGLGAAMAKFIAIASFEGPFPADYGERPAPDPAMFGLPTQDDGSRNDPLVGLNMPSCIAYLHDFEGLRSSSTRVVIGVGTTSSRTMTGRAATAVAERLGTTPVTFPGGHDGFLGGEYGQTGEPDAFADTLRQVLGGSKSQRDA
jgi:pimeloyl-ACP methyl ester carboxylesterase